MAVLIVIATVYTRRLGLLALLAALATFSMILLVRAVGVTYGLMYVALGVAAWVAMLKPGVDPVVVGLALELLTYA